MLHRIEGRGGVRPGSAHVRGRRAVLDRHSGHPAGDVLHRICTRTRLRRAFGPAGGHGGPQRWGVRRRRRRWRHVSRRCGAPGGTARCADAGVATGRHARGSTDSQRGRSQHASCVVACRGERAAGMRRCRTPRRHRCMACPVARPGRSRASARHLACVSFRNDGARRRGVRARSGQHRVECAQHSHRVDAHGHLAVGCRSHRSNLLGTPPPRAGAVLARRPDPAGRTRCCVRRGRPQGGALLAGSPAREPWQAARGGSAGSVRRHGARVACVADGHGRALDAGPRSSRLGGGAATGAPTNRVADLSF